jgi:hypothetical protein
MAARRRLQKTGWQDTGLFTQRSGKPQCATRGRGNVESQWLRPAVERISTRR